MIKFTKNKKIILILSILFIIFVIININIHLRIKKLNNSLENKLSINNKIKINNHFGYEYILDTLKNKNLEINSLKSEQNNIKGNFNFTGKYNEFNGIIEQIKDAKNLDEVSNIKIDEINNGELKKANINVIFMKNN